jgi:hypothetical protein
MQISAPGVQGTLTLKINSDANMTFSGVFKMDMVVRK